jgi:hypothetical protein
MAPEAPGEAIALRTGLKKPPADLQRLIKDENESRAAITNVEDQPANHQRTSAVGSPSFL